VHSAPKAPNKFVTSEIFGQNQFHAFNAEMIRRITVIYWIQDQIRITFKMACQFIQ
jgi:hypothetical protein